MPLYEYACSACGKLNEVLQKVSDPSPKACDGCGASGTLSRVVSRTSFVLKGGGWYSDLYGSSKKDSGSSSSSSSTSSSTSSSGGDSKSASTSSTSTPAATSPAPAASSSGGDKK